MLHVNNHRTLNRVHTDLILSIVARKYAAEADVCYFTM